MCLTSSQYHNKGEQGDRGAGGQEDRGDRGQGQGQEPGRKRVVCGKGEEWGGNRVP